MVISGTKELFIFGMHIRAFGAEDAPEARPRDPGPHAPRVPAPERAEEPEEITLYEERGTWVAGSKEAEAPTPRHRPAAEAAIEPCLYDLSGKPRSTPRPSGLIIDLFA